MRVLALAGAGALTLTLPLAALITIMLAIARRRIGRSSSCSPSSCLATGGRTSCTNQMALRLKLRLFARRNTIVADVPYHPPRA
jgi:hypothetical protein